MIEIEFTNSPAPEVIGKFIFRRKIVLLGSADNAHLLIDDDDICPMHFELKLVSDTLYGRNCGGADHFIVNGKKFVGTKIIKFGDEITIGSTTFKVTSFIPTTKSEEDMLKERYDAVSNDHPDISMLLSTLEDELLRIQLEENKQG